MTDGVPVTFGLRWLAAHAENGNQPPVKEGERDKIYLFLRHSKNGATAYNFFSIPCLIKGFDSTELI